MTDSTDGKTGKTGLSPTVTLSKNGGAFASPVGAVTEIANGWYKVAGNATDTNTLGDLILHATATGADVSDRVFNVVAFDPDLTNLTADVVQMGGQTVTASATVVFPPDPADASDIAALLTVIDDFVDTEVAAIKSVTDHLATALVLDGAVYQFTANALELGATGEPPTAEEIITELVATALGEEDGWEDVTVLDVYKASWSAGFGDAAKSGVNFVLKAPDGTTTIRTFLLDDATNPSSRTAQ